MFFLKIKDMKTIGIDISKLTFDVWSESTGHAQFSNDKEGSLHSVIVHDREGVFIIVHVSVIK